VVSYRKGSNYYGEDTSLADLAAFAGTTTISSISQKALSIGTVGDAWALNGHLVLSGGQAQSSPYISHLRALGGEPRPSDSPDSSDDDDDDNDDGTSADLTRSHRKRRALFLEKHAVVTAYELSSDLQADRLQTIANAISSMSHAHANGILSGGGSALVHAGL